WREEEKAGVRGVRTLTRQKLESFGQFVRERTAGSLFPIASTAAAAIGPVGTGCIGGVGRLIGSPGGLFALGRLSGVGTKKAVFERSAVKTADDGLHFVVGGCLDKCEALGFLGFVVADHFDSVGDEIFGSQPLFDIVGSDPCGQVAKKNG